MTAIGAAADLGAGLGLLGIDHVGIAVDDLDAAVAFYEQVLGMRCVHRESFPGHGLAEAMLVVGPADDGPRVQLLASLAEDSTIGRFLNRHGPGVQQVAYTVADVDAACAALRARGLRLVTETPQQGTAGSRVAFVHPRDTGGVLVELVEPAGARKDGSNRP